MTAMTHAIDISDETFEQEVLNADIPVLVDFWAPWCGPCKAMSPVLDALAAEYAGKVKVVKLNIDNNTDTATTYEVRSVPTLILFKGSKVVDYKIGMQNQPALSAMIKKAL